MRNIEMQLEIKRRKNYPNIKIFNYHQVSKKFDKRYHAHGTFTNITDFESQIKKIKKRYLVISLEEASNRLRDSKITETFACVTIDDGDSSIIDSAEILFEQGLPATFFINSAYIENQETSWYRVISFLENHKKYQMLLSDDLKFKSNQLRKTKDAQLYISTTAQLSDLYSKIRDEYNGHVTKSDLLTISQHGFGIASHGFRHERFNLFDKKWQIENIKKDCEILSEYDTYSNFFALPFGRYCDFNLDTQNAASELGLRLLLSTGGVNSFDQPFIHRIPADSRKLREAEYQNQEIY